MPARTLGVLGDLVEDIIVWPQEPLRPRTDTRCQVYRRQGGSAANVAVMAAREIPTRFMGSVGPDAAGAWLRQSMEAAGVDTRLQMGSHTGTIVILVRPGGDRDMLPDRGASAEITPIATNWLHGLHALHLTAYSLVGEPTASSAFDAARRVHAAGGWLSLDVSSLGLIETVGVEEFTQLLDRLSPQVLFANRDEARALGLDSPQPGRLIVIKRGGDPTTAMTMDHRVELTPPPVAVKDSTGAGDAFAAGFLAAAIDSAQTVASPTRRALEAWVSSGHRAAEVVLTTPGAGPAPRT